MRTRSRLIQIHQRVYRQVKRYASRLLGGLDPELKKYAADYRRCFPASPKVSTKEELLAAINQAQIVLCGDYHTLIQAQKTVIRLLKDILSSPGARKPLLALEIFHAKDNETISKYLSGSLSEQAFLKEVRFSENWGFPWEHYQPLLELAKQHQLEVTGINRAPSRGRKLSLLQRDQFAANLIAERSAREENALIVVVIGDLHLAPTHLPKEIETQLRKRGIERNKVIVHQNEERYYWKLAEKGKGHRVDVVQWSGNEFCVLSAAPWVKLQSHIQWIEKVVEGDAEAEALHAIQEELPTLARAITDFFDFERVTPEIDFQGNDSVEILSAIREKGQFSEAEVWGLQVMLKGFESGFIPRENVAFLSQPSLNHAAAQTSIYLHARFSGYDRVFLSPLMDFYPRVWLEALGFLGSKIVNHKRKCSGPADWEKQIRENTAGSAENLSVLMGALSHIAEEKHFLESSDRRFRGIRLTQQVSSETVLLYHLKIAKLLGELLGEGLFLGLVENRIAPEKVRPLFENDFLRPFEARRLYLDWIALLDGYDYRNIQKAGRL